MSRRWCPACWGECDRWVSGWVLVGFVTTVAVLAGSALALVTAEAIYAKLREVL